MSTYKEMSDQLDDLVSKIEDDATSLDDIVKLYDKADKLIIKMEDKLKSTEVKIQKLKSN